MLHYTYTSTGQKISQQLEDDGRMGTRREYAGPFVYVNSTLGWLNTPYGRIVALPRGGFHKELHLRDHLGNTRMVLEEIDSKYEVVQEAAYYPFGMAIPSQSFALPNENDTCQNRYLYNDNAIYQTFDNHLGGFDLTTDEGIKAANQYIQENINSIRRDLNKLIQENHD